MVVIVNKEGKKLEGDKMMIEAIGPYSWYSVYTRKGNSVGHFKNEEIEYIEINGMVLRNESLIDKK